MGDFQVPCQILFSPRCIGAGRSTPQKFKEQRACILHHICCRLWQYTWWFTITYLHTWDIFWCTICIVIYMYLLPWKQYLFLQVTLTFRRTGAMPRRHEVLPTKSGTFPGQAMGRIPWKLFQPVSPTMESFFFTFCLGFLTTGHWTKRSKRNKVKGYSSWGFEVWKMFILQCFAIPPWQAAFALWLLS